MTWTHGQRRQHLSHTHKMRPPIPRPAKLSNPPRLLPQTWVPRLRILLPQRHPLTRGTSLLRLRRKLRRIHGINQLLRNRNRIRGINRRVRLSGRPHRRVRVYRKASAWQNAGAPDPWNQSVPPSPQPQVAAEDDEYSMSDQSLGDATAMKMDDLKKLFEVKKVEEFAADDPKNPKNIQPAKKHTDD